MFLQASPTRYSWEWETWNRLRRPHGHLRLQKTGRRPGLAQRMRDTFSSVDRTAQTPAYQPQHSGECIAPDKKASRWILGPAIHDGRRDAGPADEVGASCRVIYDDELGDVEFAKDAIGDF